jgi:hypothetical protein
MKKKYIKEINKQTKNETNKQINKQAKTQQTNRSERGSSIRLSSPAPIVAPNV